MKIAPPFACVLLLAGCADFSPVVTSDQVLARQYAGHGVHGVLPGAEAQAITDNYRKNIGTHMPDQSGGVEPVTTQQ